MKRLRVKHSVNKDWKPLGVVQTDCTDCGCIVASRTDLLEDTQQECKVSEFVCGGKYNMYLDYFTDLQSIICLFVFFHLH